MQGYDDLLYKPILGPSALNGISDTLGLLSESLGKPENAGGTAPSGINAVGVLQRLCDAPLWRI